MGKYREQLSPQLEKLPIPELKETLNKLIEWVDPFVSAEELDAFKKEVDFFAVNQGPELQEKLVTFSEDKSGSWLADFWQESYLKSRGFLQSESNFALVIAQEYENVSYSKVEKAARIIRGLTQIYIDFATESYPLERTKQGQLVDMSFYLNFFKSSRIPKKELDLFYRGASDIKNSHVVVLINGLHFQLNVTDDSGNLYSLKQLTESLNYLVTTAEYPVEGEKWLPYFTGVKREHSEKMYNQLQENKANQQNLRSIEEALFIVSFSTSEDDSESERIKEVLLNGSQQFFSKTTQIIITKNNHIGFNIEHTAVDGVPTLMILTELFKRFNEEEATSYKESSSSLIKKLDWQLSNQTIKELEKCKEIVEQESDSYLIQHFEVLDFGKKAMKQVKISPDAFFHIALAMAQQAVFGKLKSVYEPVAMRSFYEGRTECARSISTEKKAFVKAYTERKSNDQLLELFKVAVAAHAQRIHVCQKGKGIERHLFGLQKMTLDSAETDYFFLADPLKKLTTDFISTTGIPFELLESFSFGPVEKAGFGLYYGLLEEKVVLTISAKKEQKELAEKLLLAIEQALYDLAELTGIQLKQLD